MAAAIGRVRSRSGGFSILELLVVLAVVGILFAIATPSYLAWQVRTSTREAAVQLARSIDRARIDTKRTGVSITVSATELDPFVFVVDGTDQSLPSLVEVTSTSSVSFNPPYGTQEEAEVEFRIVSTRDASVGRTVRVVGVLGKVVIE